MSVSPDKLAAAVTALQTLRSQDVPAWEQSFITDSLLTQIATIVLESANAADALTALQNYRSQEVPWYEQGEVSDTLLTSIVNTVLSA